MQEILVVLVVALAAACLLLLWKLQARQPAPALARADDGLQGKLDATKKEVGALKEELAKKQRLLEEAREDAKRRAKKEAQKAERAEVAKPESDPRDVELAGLKRGMSALEQQLETLKKDAERRVQEARMTSESEAERKLREVQAEADALRQTLDELRASIKRKQEERPDIPGTAVDLKALPSEAVQELARYFRKAEEYERLYHVSAGQLQLAQDKILELQRRYYAVCRELAVAAGNAGTISDEDAKRNAEALLAAGDTLGHAAGHAARGGGPERGPRQGQGQGQGQGGGEPRPPQYVLGPDGQPVLGPDGQPLRKKRRRRRKKKPGAPGEAAAAGAEGGDDEGADDEGGDEGGDEGAPETSSEASAETSTEAKPDAPAPSA